MIRLTINFAVIHVINSFEVRYVILKQSNIYSFVYKNNVHLAVVFNKMIHYPEEFFSFVSVAGFSSHPTNVQITLLLFLHLAGWYWLTRQAGTVAHCLRT